MWRIVVVAGLIALGPGVAAAQVRGRVPAADMNALGLSIGVAVPGDDTLGPGPALAVSFEHYFTPRVSLRGRLGGAWFGIDQTGAMNGVSPASFDGDVVYNWERGKVHPFAFIGLGAETFRFTENGVDSHDTTGGINLGGGIEYFFRLHDTVTAELEFKPLVGQVESRARTYSPWYWQALAGYKKYF